MRRMMCMRGVMILLIAPLLGACSYLSTSTEVSATFGEAFTSTGEGISYSTVSTSGGDDKKTAFVTTRFAAIRAEAARGAGEHLDSLALLLDEPDRAAFGRWMQANYTPLFVGLREPSELLTRIAEQRPHRG